MSRPTDEDLAATADARAELVAVFVADGLWYDDATDLADKVLAAGSITVRMLPVDGTK